MAKVWRLLLILCVAAMVAPATGALVLVGWGKFQGCAPDAICAPEGLGSALAFMLDWSWRRILDMPVLAFLTGGAAVGAAYGFETRNKAMLWSLAGACWGPIAALILPYVVVIWSMPEACQMTRAGAASCVLWGHTMAEAYSLAGAAFWWSVVIVPAGLGGLLVTFVLFTLKTRGNGFPGAPR